MLRSKYRTLFEDSTGRYAVPVAAVKAPDAERRVVPALARGLEVLERLAARGPQTGAELSRDLGLPRSTVHDLLRSLVALGYAREVDPQVHSFALGPAVLTLGHSYLAALDFNAEAAKVARELSEQTGETAQVAVLDGTDALYVAKAESSHHLRLVSAVGRRLPAHLTGVGKALLAYLPEPELDRLFAGSEVLPTMTEHSIGTLPELKERLDAIRRSGLAYDYCESNPDVACVAAPIFDSENRVTAGLSLSLPVTRWSVPYRDTLAGHLLAATRRLSQTLGAPRP